MDRNGYEQNSYGSYYGTPENPMGTNSSLAKGSAICGFISLGLGISAIFSMFAVPVGAVGCILGMLSSRRGKNAPKSARTGVITSTVGLLIGVFMTASVLITTFSRIPLSTLIQQYNEMYEQMENGTYDFSNYSTLQDYLYGSDSISR